MTMEMPEAPNADTLRLDVIRGDGIGPEIIDSALTVLSAIAEHEGFTLSTREIAGGAAVYRDVGQPLADDDLDRMREADAIIKGPVGLPDVRRPDGTEGGLLGGVMRLGLDTYANVRPVRLRPGVTGATRHESDQIDYVIVRENTEGLYLGRGNGVTTPNAAADQMLITRAGTERVVDHAFRLARKRRGAPGDGVRRVTCVDKSNVLRSFALFRSVFSEVASRYPDVEADYVYADAAAQAQVVAPERFDVLVMENFLGDILSDLGAGTVGGVGMCGAGNIGDAAAYFEPLHGSAPDIAGLDRANPISQIQSLTLLLDHIGRPSAAQRLERALDAALTDGSLKILPSGAPESGTKAATESIVAKVPAPASV